MDTTETETRTKSQADPPTDPTKPLCAAVHKASENVNQETRGLVSEVIKAIQKEFGVNVEKVGSQKNRTNTITSDIDYVFIFDLDKLPGKKSELAANHFERAIKVVKHQCKNKQKIQVSGNRNSAIEVIFENDGYCFDISPKFEFNQVVWSFNYGEYIDLERKGNHFVPFKNDRTPFPFPKYCRFVKRINNIKRIGIESYLIEEKIRLMNTSTGSIVENCEEIQNLHLRFLGTLAGSDKNFKELIRATRDYQQIPFFST